MTTIAQKSIETQITEARARATTCSCRVLLIRRAAPDLLAILTSAKDASRVYTIRRDRASGTLRCSCPARVVCKHIGMLLVWYGVSYRNAGRHRETQPAVPDFNSPEPATDEPNTQDEKPYHFPPAEEARLVAFRRVAAWLASLKAPAIVVVREASVALQLAERSERALTGQVYTQEERLQALACLPVVIASYAIVMGPAHARQWHQAKEEQWDKYQAARLNGSLSW